MDDSFQVRFSVACPDRALDRYIGAFFVAIGAWFAILFTDEYRPFRLRP